MKFYKAVWKNSQAQEETTAYLKANGIKGAREYLKLRLAKESEVTELKAVSLKQIPKDGLLLNFKYPEV